MMTCQETPRKGKIIGKRKKKNPYRTTITLFFFHFNIIFSAKLLWFFRMCISSLYWFPVHLQTCRALMIMSLLIGLVSIFVSVLGLKCTKLGRTSEQVKGQMVLSGGVLFLLSGMKSRTLSVF